MHEILRAGIDRRLGAGIARRTVGAALASLLLLAAAVPPPAVAQQYATITVFVRGPDGPVAGAVLTLDGVSVPADERGIARLAVLPGAYLLRVAGSGLLPAEQRLTVRAPVDTLLVVHLTAAPLRAEPIIVRTTRGERRIDEAPLRVEVISREEIEEKLLMTPGSIAMLLDELPGVRVQATSPGLGGAVVRIQGLRGRYAQILVDGMPLHGAQPDALGPLQIAPMDLHQVEVIKGAVSALYGGSALAGVVNLISRAPEGGREVLTNRTSRGGTDVVFWSSDVIEAGWGYTLLAGLHAQDPQDIGGDGWLELARHRRVVARPRLFWNEGPHRLMFTIGLTSESRTGGGFLPDGERYDREVETQRADAAVLGRLAVDDALAADLRAAATHSARQRRFDDRVEDDILLTAFAEVALRGRAGRHDWVLGTALVYDDFDARTVAEMSYAHVTAGLFAQHEVAPLRRLAFFTSARLDFHNVHGRFFSPRAAVLAGPFGEWTLRLSAGRGYHVPTPLVADADEIGLARIEPLAGLVPERARTIALDIGAVFGFLELNGTAFVSRVDNPVVFREPTAPGRGALVNLPGPTRTRGTELLARLRAAPFSLTAYHTFLYATEPDPVRNTRAAVPLTPRLAAGVLAMWEEDADGRIGVECYYTGSQRLADDPFSERSDSYVVVGVLVERRVGPVHVFVNAENLTNVRQTRDRPLVRPEPTMTGRWTTDVWAPLEGRVVNGGFRVFF